MALTRITTGIIADNTLAVANIADNAVDATKIASNSILTRHIDDDQITGAQLADNIDIVGTLDVTGATTLDSTLGVTGAITGNLTGNASGTALTVTQAAQTAITSLGTLTSLAITGDLDIADTGAGAITVGGTTNTYNFPVVINATDAGLAISDGTKTIGIWGTHGGSSHAGSAVGTRSNHDLAFITNDTKRSIISSTGKTSWSAGGIGAVQTQSRDFTFYTEGGSNGVDIRSNDYSIGFIGAAGSSGAGMDTGYFQILNAGTVKAALNSNGDSYFNGGNVGIGTASPADKLHVVGDIRIDGGNQMTNELAWFNGSNYLAGIRQASHSSYNDSGGLQFLTSGTSNAAESVKMVIDTQGNVGIGTTSPDYRLVVKGGAATNDNIFKIEDSAGTKMASMEQDSSGNGRWIVCDTDGNADILLHTAGTSTLGGGAVAIFGGTLYVSGEGATFSAGSHNGMQFALNGQSISSRAATNAQTHKSFYNPNGQVGTISTNASATAYNTSSDYRLKENVVTDWDGTTLLKQLKPSKFNFKADTDTIVQGFLAHEVSNIVPQAIAGEKDAVYTAEEALDGEGIEGQPHYQGIDQSKLVPLLVKTIQELEARITTLEG